MRQQQQSITVGAKAKALPVKFTQKFKILDNWLYPAIFLVLVIGGAFVCPPVACFVVLIPIILVAIWLGINFAIGSLCQLLFMHSWMLLLLVPAAGYLLYTLGRQAWTAGTSINRADFNEKAILVSSTLFGQRDLPWRRVSALMLTKPASNCLPEDCSMSVVTATGAKYDVPLESLTNHATQSTLFQLIQEWAPHVVVDQSLLDLWDTKKQSTYTELWLDSYHGVPKRNRTGPLAEGDQLLSSLYKVKTVLGSGGQGTAYVAEATVLKNEVVLKEFVLPCVVDRAQRQRVLQNFETEVKVLKKLHHQAIVKLLDFFVEDYRAYLVLEYIHGQSLRELVRTGGPLSEERVWKLARQMLNILSYLHEQAPPIVHRDFTPDNLILQEAETLKLIDFNVAHLADATTTSNVVGKQSYIPPEQFRGQPVPASDLYALGCCLQFLLSGQDPEPLSQSTPILLDTDISQAMNDLVVGLTQQDPETRFSLSTAQEACERGSGFSLVQS